MGKMTETTAHELAMNALRERIERLEEALKPFAAVADEYSDSEDDDFEVWVDAGPIKLIRYTFRLDMYRAARAALTTPSELVDLSPSRECDGQLCYYHGCQRLPECRFTAPTAKGEQPLPAGHRALAQEAGR